MYNRPTRTVKPPKMRCGNNDDIPVERTNIPKRVGEMIMQLSYMLHIAKSYIIYMYMYVYSEQYSIKLNPCIERKEKPVVYTGILQII